MPEKNEFDKSVTLITDEKEYHNWRMTIAMHAASGLLASQPETGWSLDRLAQVSLRTADTLLRVASAPLPEPTTAPVPSPQDKAQAVELEVVEASES